MGNIIGSRAAWPEQEEATVGDIIIVCPVVGKNYRLHSGYYVHYSPLPTVSSSSSTVRTSVAGDGSKKHNDGPNHNHEVHKIANGDKNDEEGRAETDHEQKGQKHVDQKEQHVVNNENPGPVPVKQLTRAQKHARGGVRNRSRNCSRSRCTFTTTATQSALLVARLQQKDSQTELLNTFQGNRASETRLVNFIKALDKEELHAWRFFNGSGFWSMMPLQIPLKETMGNLERLMRDFHGDPEDMLYHLEQTKNLHGNTANYLR